VTFVITQPCIDTTDQSCVEVCPVDCIHFEEGADRMLYINPVECIDCGACQPACPVSAIFPDNEVPADQQAFTPINELWYSDPAAARAQVQGLAGGAAAPAAVSAAGAPSAEAATDAEAATTAPAAAAPAAAPATPPAKPAAATVQVPAAPLSLHAVSTLPPHLSPFSLIMLTGFLASMFVVFVLPGPVAVTLDGIDLAIREGKQFNITWGGQIAIGVLLGLPLALFFLGAFLTREMKALGSFSAHGARRASTWRWQGAGWRRSEEMRGFTLQQAVADIARDRYRFPNAAHPELRTHVNLPAPSMALEFGAGGGEKVFPDILVVTYPGNRPTMVVQVETRETLTREQAEYVWARLESEQAPLDLYVPAGLAARAKDYAKAAGIKHVRVRTWRWQPTGLTVREV
jgi:NAD-dependent dihydropyrimidine dehydrogenase PreA subunit